MSSLVEKVLPDGTSEVLHQNLNDADAGDLMRRVLAFGGEGVQVRITPLVFNEKAGDHLPVHDLAKVYPLEPAADEEADAQPAKKK